MAIFEKLMTFLDELIIADEPIKSIAIAIAMAIIICTSVIFIGLLIDKLGKLEIKIITKLSSEKRALFIMNRLMFPGVVMHELAHVLFAWATGAQIKKVRMITFFDAHRLGYVNFQPTGKKSQQRIQLALTSCAPVMMGLIELYIIQLLMQTAFAPWQQFLLIYLFVSILNHMSMSEQDVKNYLRGMLTVFPLVLLTIYAMRIFTRT